MEIPPEKIIFGRPKFTEEEIEKVASVMRSGWVGTGPRTQEFENKFSKYVGAEFGVAVSSCATALELALISCGIGPGDEVLTSSFTFAATVNSILKVGASPILVDVEPQSFQMDLRQVEGAITHRTKAILPVHFAGAPVDVDQLLSLRQRFGLRVISDSAHAIEAQWRGLSLGNFFDVSCYSFGPSKNITTVEGGMICSNDPEIERTSRLRSQQGVSLDAWNRMESEQWQHYDVVLAGQKARLTDWQAVLGLSQLADIESNYRRRESLWDFYVDQLKDLPLQLPEKAVGAGRHALHLFSVLVSHKENRWTREQWLMALRNYGVHCGVHYRCLAEYSYYQRHLAWNPAAFPNAVTKGRQVLSLPFSHTLSWEEARRVVETVRKVGEESER